MTNISKLKKSIEKLLYDSDIDCYDVIVLDNICYDSIVIKLYICDDDNFEKLHEKQLFKARKDLRVLLNQNEHFNFYMNSARASENCFININLLLKH